MNDDVILPDVKHFILQNIDSVAQIEGLILIRTNPQAEWDAALVSERLYIDHEAAAALLLQLTERGLFSLAATARYKYCLQSPERENILERVIETYRQYLLPVTHLIHSSLPQSRIQKFADAFIIKKGKD
jgi:hypothetical protein